MIPEEAILLIKRFEGCILSPYLCPAGVPTIGYGSTRYEDGTPVSLMDSPITKERADELLRHEANQCARNVLRYSKTLAVDQRAFAAIIDFAFNLGSGAYRGSTLRKRIDAGDREGARKQIVRWNKAGGKVLRGLTLRRQAEAALL